MGKRRFRRKPRRRRRFKKRKPRPMKSLMGQSKVVRHKWAHAGQLSIGTGNLCITESFRLLGPFEPALSGAGNQPLGFSQMASIFDNCQVLGAKVTVTYLPSTAQHNVVFWTEISPTPRQGQPSINLQAILDRKNTSYTYLATNQGNGTKQVLHRRMNPRNYFDITDIKDNVFYKCIPANSVPAQDLYLNTALSSTHPALGTSVVGNDYVITISYVINWFQPAGNVP